MYVSPEIIFMLADGARHAAGSDPATIAWLLRNRIPVALHSMMSGATPERAGVTAVPSLEHAPTPA